VAGDIKISVDLEIDERGFVKNFDKIKGKVKQPARRAGEQAGEQFNKGFRSKASDLGNSLGALKSSFFGATAAIAAVAFTTSRAVQAAIRQEDAVNRLNTALKVNGNFSREASRSLQEFASEIQRTTRFGDEAVLEQLRLAQAFGANVDQSQAAVKAATDLATAFGIDLTSATRNVAKTLGGYAGELGEVIPELKDLSQEQLKAGAGIDLIAKKFSGFAENDAKNFSGALDQASNSFGDLLEGFGRLITEAPASSSLISDITQAFQGATQAIDDFRISLSQNNADEQAKRINQIKVEIIDLEQANMRAEKSLNGIARARDKAFTESRIAARKQEIIELTDELKNLEVTQKKQAEIERQQDEDAKKLAGGKSPKVEAAKRTNEQILSELGNAGLTRLEILNAQEQRELALLQEATERKLISQQDAEARRSEIILNAENERNAILEQIRQEQQDLQFNFAGNFAEGFLNSTQTANQALKEFAANARKQGAAFRDGLARGVGQGFAAFGQALATGENAFDAFAKAFLGTLGQLMIQQGTAFILQGIGFSVIPGLQANGGTLIAAGSALAVFGGALSALAGGGGAAAAGGSAAVGGAGATGVGGEGTTESPIIGQAEEREEPETRVTVNINGDVFDSDETGTRLAQILSDSFQSNGIVISNGSFA